MESGQGQTLGNPCVWWAKDKRGGRLSIGMERGYVLGWKLVIKCKKPWRLTLNLVSGGQVKLMKTSLPGVR